MGEGEFFCEECNNTGWTADGDWTEPCIYCHEPTDFEDCLIRDGDEGTGDAP